MTFEFCNVNLSRMKDAALKEIRQQVISTLWQDYCQRTPQLQIIKDALQRKGVRKLYLDHFAIIDLPGPISGIPVLRKLFSTLGFRVRGQGYLPEKQNDFCWLAEIDSEQQPAKMVLPQVVVADFRLNEMPNEISAIVKKYVGQATKLPPIMGETEAPADFISRIQHYLAGRDWPLPTLKELSVVEAFNPLLAWVLVFGRRPNHFTISIHLHEQFQSLKEFQQFIVDEVKLPLNEEGGWIKGSAEAGIEQGSTLGWPVIIALPDGEIQMRTGFVEFVWRHAQSLVSMKELTWNSYFTGFIAHQANHVIESLYQKD